MKIKILQISLLLFLVVTLAKGHVASPRDDSSSSESLEEYADEYDEYYEEYSDYYGEE